MKAAFSEKDEDEIAEDVEGAEEAEESEAAASDEQ